MTTEKREEGYLNSTSSNNSSPKNDLGKQYNFYYEGGENSLWSQRCGKKVISRDRWALENATVKLYENHNIGTLKRIRILDHGCGDGRYLSFFQDIAHKVKEKDVKVEVIAYDPSNVGLQNYKERLLKGNFKVEKEGIIHDIDESLEAKGARGYEGPTLKSDNLTIKFIHSDVDDSIEHTKKLIGEVDVTICMFGVLSHIPGRKNRQETLKMFNDITNPEGATILTLPTAWKYRREQIAYDILREQQRTETFGLATESGDILYAKLRGTKAEVLNYYHVYSVKELKEDLKIASLYPERGIQSDAIFDMGTLTKNSCASNLLEKADEWASWLTPEPIVDYISSYMLVVAKREEFVQREGGRQSMSCGII